MLFLLLLLRVYLTSLLHTGGDVYLIDRFIVLASYLPCGSAEDLDISNSTELMMEQSQIPVLQVGLELYVHSHIGESSLH